MEPLKAQGESPGYAEPLPQWVQDLRNDIAILRCARCGLPSVESDFQPKSGLCKSCSLGMSMATNTGEP